MPTSSVTVYKYGKPASGQRVRLGFTGITNMGQTSDSYTDADGVAYINHRASGNADIYVNGSKVGSMNAPGGGSVNI